MEPTAVTSFALDRPLDLRITLGTIGHGPSLRIRGDEAWRATLTPEGPATVHLRRFGDTVQVEAWGAGAGWAASRAAALCGQEDDDSTFAPVHRFVADLRRHHPGARLPRTSAVFEALVPDVIGQKVTTVEANRSYRELVDGLGEAAPGPVRMKVPPGAAVLSRTPYWTFHRFGIERRRAEVIITAARSAKRLEEILAMDSAAARARLEAFPGIGPWTSAKVAMVALGDADAVPVGDYHLAHHVGYVFEGTVRSTDERMLQLLEPYRGHRGRVVRLITLSGVSAPRFGPRMPLRNIAEN